jgi:hypothetical protein
MKQRTIGTVLAARQWSQNLRLYVQTVPGDGGKDWGYTMRQEEALPLNKYFARRFNADCVRVGAVAQFTPAYFHGA